MGDSVTVTISNWEKFNPRKDYKKPWWFALDNRLVEDDEFFNFSHGEFKAWIYILSRASQKSSDTVSISFDGAKRKSGLTRKDIDGALKKLKKIGAVVIRTESVQDLFATDITEQTEQNRTKHNKAEKFDFEILYKKYPRQIGKTKGLEKCHLEIKTPEDYAALNFAIDQYVLFCKGGRLEDKFIKHFSTFMTSWRDWTDPEAGKSENFTDKFTKVDWEWPNESA